MKLIKYLLIGIVSATMVSTFAFANTNNDIVSTVKNNNTFGFDLYQKLKKEKGNLFFSPYSISTALTMTYTGARGQTEIEMAKVLHFSLGQKSPHNSLSKLQSYLNTIQNSGDVKLSIANSLWLQEGYPVLDAFIDLNKKSYGASLNFVDFKIKTEDARKAINTWTENKTEYKIKELIKPNVIDARTRLVLCNAIYFKGNWLRQFDKKRTMSEDFHISSRRTIKVPMMSQKSRTTFKDFGNFSAIKLPYKGDSLSMIIFLPKEIDGLKYLEKDLTGDNVANWIDKLSNSKKSEIYIKLPKFKATCEFELSKKLAQMGMPSPFSNHADFSGINGKTDLKISKVIHKAFISVDEEGTEAAAATAVIMARKHIPSKCLTFTANHPFVYLISDSKTGSILFMGRVVNSVKP